MAKLTRPNPFLNGASGKIGDLVFKQYKYGIVITKVPDMKGIKPSKDQKQKRRTFAEAVAYAKSIVADPVKSAKWKKKVKRGSTVYHTAISAYLKKRR